MIKWVVQDRFRGERVSGGRGGRVCRVVAPRVGHVLPLRRAPPRPRPGWATRSRRSTAPCRRAPLASPCRVRSHKALAQQSCVGACSPIKARAHTRVAAHLLARVAYRGRAAGDTMACHGSGHSTSWWMCRASRAVGGPLKCIFLPRVGGVPRNVAEGGPSVATIGRNSGDTRGGHQQAARGSSWSVAGGGSWALGEWAAGYGRPVVGGQH